MNEELIRQCAREANAAEQGDLGLSALAQHVLSGRGDDCRGMRLATEAIRLYHARHVAPEPSEEEVERLAKWMVGEFATFSWCDADERCRNGWRERARAALAAMGRV